LEYSRADAPRGKGALVEIGLFQLENLIHSHIRFVLLDLRKQAEPLPEALAAISARCMRLSVKNLEEYLVGEKAHKEAPVILLCENGKSSSAVASQLESAGYTNIYVVEGGVEGLLSEL
jgi:rhodanese-related sulfurtransferase